MPDFLRFGLPVAVLIAVGGALLLIALTPAPVTSTTQYVPITTEHHVTTTPHQPDTQEVTSNV